MKVCLLYENSENGFKRASMNQNEIVKDLNLDIIFKTMARNDKFIYNTVRTVMTSPLADQKTILYRQAILTDCIKRFDDFNKIYEMTAQSLEMTERYTEAMKKSAASRLSNASNVMHSLELLGILVDNVEMLKDYISTVEMNFTSHGMLSFYDQMLTDYNYEFLSKIKAAVKEMNFLTEGGEITFSASIGSGLKANDLVINSIIKKESPSYKNKNVVSRILYNLFRRNVILLEDSGLKQDARELEAAGLAGVLKMYQNFIRELETFFENLHYQMAFYVGAANLAIRLKQLHIPTTMPFVANTQMDIFKFQGLYDLSLAIFNREKPISNELSTEDMRLFIITGANQGGKSTYLRSIGVAQLFMQCGMFVPADSYSNIIFDGIYSHFTRREDTAMNSGKLDEELSRMNRILTTITPNSLLLMNESFATTTEREGSKIARDVVNALYENKTKIIMVTHLFEFTKSIFEKKPEQAMFLSAERLEDGTRTFRIYEKEPERTSYGLDLYDAIIN